MADAWFCSTEPLRIEATLAERNFQKSVRVHNNNHTPTSHTLKNRNWSNISRGQALCGGPQIQTGVNNVRRNESCQNRITFRLEQLLAEKKWNYCSFNGPKMSSRPVSLESHFRSNAKHAQHKTSITSDLSSAAVFPKQPPNRRVTENKAISPDKHFHTGVIQASFDSFPTFL